MLGLLPFLFWLMGTTRPRTIAQLGVGDGVVYMGLCQAIERLGDSAVCIGVQTGEPLMTPAMRAQHDAQYADFSEILPGDPTVVAHRLGGKIDLLVLNQAMDSEGICQLQSELIPYLSDSSIILICGHDHVFPNYITRKNLFLHEHRSFTLESTSSAGRNLEIVLYGENQAERLTALMEQRPGMPAYLASRQAFNRLGQGIEAIHKAEILEDERNLLQESLKSAESMLKSREKEVDGQHAEIKAARAAEATGVSLQADTLAKIHDLQQILLEKDREGLALEAEHAQARNAHAAQLSELNARSQAREAEHLAELEAARRKEATAVAALEAEIQTLSAGKAEAETHLARAREAHAAQLSELNARSQAREAEHLAVLEAARGREATAVAALEAEIQTLSAGKTEAETQLAQAREAHAARIEDIALLTSKYYAEVDGLKQQIQSAEAGHQAELETARKQKAAIVTTLKAEIQTLSAGKAAAETQLAQVRDTFSNEIGRIAKIFLTLLDKKSFFGKRISAADKAEFLVKHHILDREWYLQQHPDVAENGIEPSLHYVLHGAEEGRAPKRMA